MADIGEANILNNICRAAQEGRTDRTDTIDEVFKGEGGFYLGLIPGAPAPRTPGRASRGVAQRSASALTSVARPDCGSRGGAGSLRTNLETDRL